MDWLKIKWLCLVLAAVVGCSPQGSIVSREIELSPFESGVFKVMTFDLSCGSADADPNGWQGRKSLVVDVLADRMADVIGLQGATDFQAKAIQRALPHYTIIMAGADDGKRGGSVCAILYRSDRFRRTDWGTFWFSNTPWKAGSKHWGNETPRICTWVRLTELAAGKSFYVYNVHLDHQSQVSRQKSAELLIKEIANRPTNEPFVVLGDFNMETDNPAMLYLQKIGYETPYSRLVDSWQMLYRAEQPAGTVHHFKGDLSGPKIDHVLVRDDTEIIEVGIDRRAFEGRYPSDHFPVYAEIKLF